MGRALLRTVAAVGACALLTAHSPYRQWDVYRKARLVIVASYEEQEAVRLGRATGSASCSSSPRWLELGPHGVRVNVVAPGLTLTDATHHLPKAMHDAVAAHTPLRRLAVPDDVAGAVLFFCMDESRHVTGTYLPVCGGSQMP